jgi:pimeloyl-ACP methyl ester carboxylesterase
MKYMRKFISIILLIFVFTGCTSYAQNQNLRFANNDYINIWSESFGNHKNPAVLLISGAGSQGILWPDIFCKELAKQGYFVIRFDHRDSGKSTSVNYLFDQYTIMDMAKDAVAVLDHYKIKKANIVGFSMGGQIGQFLGAYYPNRVNSLTLIATSTSFKEGFRAFLGNYNHDDNDLSQPSDEYLSWTTSYLFNKHKSNLEGSVDDFMECWRMLNGNQTPFDEELFYKIALENYYRGNGDNAYNHHAFAMISSFDEHAKVPQLIKAPTIVLHGTADPLFGVDHGQSLQKNIKGAKLIIVEGMGHCLNTKFYGKIINAIKEVSNKSQID